jgi:hypothetical protein
VPAESVAQRRLFAIAEHHPEELYPENRSLAKVSKEKLRHYSKTKEKGLPQHVAKRKARARR